MEVSLIEEEAKIEIIEGTKALRYKVKSNGKDINNVPVYSQWLRLMKSEKGENGIITYCRKCQTFFYFENLLQKHLMLHDNCTYYDFSEFCEYCGELYNEDSICCLKKAFDIFKQYIYTVYFDADRYYILFLPIFILMWNCLTVFKIIFFKRNKKYCDINFIDIDFLDVKKNIVFFIFMFLFSLFYVVVFIIPYFFTIYFFQLFLMIKLYRQKLKDKANNIIRY